MTRFQINDELEVRCSTLSNRAGFKHVATLYKNGEKVTSASQQWCNRTWESWTFRTALVNLETRLGKHYDARYAAALSSFIEHYKEPNAFAAVGMVAAFGAIFGKDEKEANDWKKRMIATVPGISMPEDFDSLPEAERARRLDAVIEVMKGDNND